MKALQFEAWLLLLILGIGVERDAYFFGECIDLVVPRIADLLFRLDERTAHVKHALDVRAVESADHLFRQENWRYALSRREGQLNQEDQARYVLLVEDDISTRAMLQIELRRLGYRVTPVPGVVSAVELLRQYSYFAVVMDIELEDGTAYELFEQDLLKDTIVIIVSVRESVDEKLKTFRLGADDYMVKPLDARELAARLERYSSRRFGLSSVLDAGHSIIIDEHRALQLIDRTIFSKDKVRPLSKAEFLLLQLMLRDRKAIITKDAIKHEVLHSHVASDSRSPDVLVSRLRRKLSFFGPHDFLNSIRGVGYRFDPKDT